MKFPMFAPNPLSLLSEDDIIIDLMRMTELRQKKIRDKECAKYVLDTLIKKIEAKEEETGNTVKYNISEEIVTVYLERILAIYKEMVKRCFLPPVIVKC